MNTQSRTRFPLSKNEVITLNRPLGWSIKAHTGRLWITQSNNFGDIFLEEGQVFVAKENGVLIAEAMNHALVSFESPAHSKAMQMVCNASSYISKELLAIIPTENQTTCATHCVSQGI